MHVHQSLFKGGKNAFFDPKDPYHLSKTARRYIAGLLKHAPGDHRRHQPVGQLLQAAGAGLRGAGLPLLGAAQPLRPDPRAGVQAGQGEGHPHRVPLTGPGLQPLPGLLRHAGRRAGRASRRGCKPPEPVEENVYEMTRGRAEGARHRHPARQPLGGHPADGEERAGAEGPRRARLQRLHREQEDRVGPVPDPGDRVRAEAVPADPVVSTASAATGVRPGRHPEGSSPGPIPGRAPPGQSG